VRVLVTRALPDALATAERVRRAGHEPLVVPLIERRPGPDLPALLASSPDVLLLTSAATARVIAQSAGDWRPRLIAAVGPATASAGMPVDVVGSGTGADLVAQLALAPGTHVAYPGAAKVASPTLAALRGHNVHRYTVYETAALQPELPDVDAVLLCSPSAAKAWRALGGEGRAIAIGPTTAAALDVPCEIAAQPTVAAMLDCL